MKKTLSTLILIGVQSLSTIAGGSNVNEIMECSIELLEAHSFSQMSEHQEYVCVNEDDRTDFVIIEDEKKELKIWDKVLVELDKDSNVLDYNVITKE